MLTAVTLGSRDVTEPGVVVVSGTQRDAEAKEQRCVSVLTREQRKYYTCNVVVFRGSRVVRDRFRASACVLENKDETKTLLVIHAVGAVCADDGER